MNVLWAVVAHGLKVEVLQDIQGLLEHGGLCPGIVAQNFVTLEGAANRLTKYAFVVG